MSTVVMMNQYTHAVEILPIQRYEKSLLSRERIDFAAIYSGDYGEVRWDKNGDGQIDIWFLRKGGLQVQEEIEDNQIKRISIQHRAQSGHIYLTYTLTKAGILSLTENEFRPYDIQNNSVVLEDEAASSFGAAVVNSKNERSDFKNNICKTSIEEFFGSAPADWAALQSAVALEGQESRLAKMVSDQCKSLLSSKEQEQLYKSIRNIYELDLDGKVEDNKVLSCLVQYKELHDHIPIIATTLALAPVSQPQMKINCIARQSKKCGQASFDEKSCRIDLAISTPVCKEDMEQVFTTDIFHETLHSAAPKLSEKSISAITNECLKADVRVTKADGQISDKTKPQTNLKEELAKNPVLQKLATDTSKAEENIAADIRANLKSEDVGIMKMPTAAIKDVNSKVASNVVTNVPAEIAAGKVGPGAPIGAKSGMASLNSDFRPTTASNASSKPTLNESYSRSVARTSPVLSMANSLVRSAVVVPAQAQSQASSSDFRPSRNIASSNENRLKSSAGSNSNRSSVKTGQSLWLSKSTATANPIINANSPSVNMVLPSNPQIMPSQASGLNQVQGSSEIAGSSGVQAAASPKPGKATTRTPASSVSAGAQLKNSTPNDPSASSPASANTQRDFYIKQLTMKRGSDLWDFVKKNNENLKNQGIHILDVDNRIWGHMHPESAVIRFREQNNRLIREN